VNSKNRRYYFKPTYQRWCFIAGTLASLSLLSPVQAELDVPAEVLSNIQQTGTARIIVNLKMAEQPDGGLATINQLQMQFRNEIYPPLPDGVSNPMAAQEIKHQYRTIPAMALEVGFDTMSKIPENSLVASIEEDGLSPATLSESIPIIEADSVWDLGYSGAGQAVAVLDTGVDLEGKVVSEACYSTTSTSLNATTLCPNGNEDQVGNGAGVACSSSGCSHGTHVAGIVAANGSVQGVAKDAKIIAIQVFTLFNNPQYCGFSGSCVLSFTSDQIAGLERVLELHESGGMDNNIASVNMSLGNGNYSDVCNGAIQGVIDNLRAVGIATIVASGNGYHTNGIASPACISSAISVGATTKSDTIPNYSNSADILDLLAPGSFIESTLPGGSTGWKSGTSMAAPHVAGAFAVLKPVAQDASVNDILNVLKITGTPIEDWRPGIPNLPRITPRINLKKALERLAPEPPPATPDISVAPTSHDFGDVKVNESSSATVTISNTGDGDLEIGQLALTDGDFIINVDNCSNVTVAASNNCTVTITFEPQTEGAKSATLSIPSNDFDTPTVEIALSGDGIVDVVTPIIAPASCHLYAVNDTGLNNSQFFTVSIDGDFTIIELGPMYKGHDIEALAIHPETNMIYAASGDNVTNGKKGHFYRVDGKTGELFPVGSTGFKEIEDLAFSSDGTLYAWAKDDGLITIDLTTGNGNMEIPSNAQVEGLALSENNDTTRFFGAVNTDLELWKYNPNSGNLNICPNLPGETEALEMMPDGLLLFGTHNDSSFSLHAFDPQACQLIADKDIPTGKFNDVEGIALSFGACAE